MVYCPACGLFYENSNQIPDGSKVTFSNCRDGWGIPITHFKCRCGNEYAGMMRLRSDYVDVEGLVDYYKDVITGYNPGGIYTNEYWESKTNE